jgi:murein DD-endopeptidase MepM/ murein hydrolase activator NlpD
VSDKPYIEPLHDSGTDSESPVKYCWNATRIFSLLILFAVIMSGSAFAYQSHFSSGSSQSLVAEQNKQPLSELSADRQTVNNQMLEDQAAQKQAAQQSEQIFWNSTYPFLPVDNQPLNADRMPSFYTGYCSTAEDCLPEETLNKWPLKPFNKPRPIISFLNDLRPKSMHYGVDIQARTNQKVYAIQPGYARIIEASGLEARVQVGNFIYWHININVQEGEYVEPLKTVVGTVQKGFGHLHLSEVDNADQYINPLRPGHKTLPGWKDTLPPVLGDLYLESDGTVDVDSFDRQSLRNKKPYITPTTNLAALAYKLDYSSKKPDPYSDSQALQFAYQGQTNYSFSSVSEIYDMIEPPLYGSACYPKKKKCPFYWRYKLAGGLAEPLTADYGSGEYWLTVYAWDWDNNLISKQLKLNYSEANGWSKNNYNSP